MFRLDDVWDEGLKIVGACSESRLIKKFGDAASLIVNKNDFEGLKGWLDICTTGCSCSPGSQSCQSTCCGWRCIALPREVAVPLAVNIGGRPTLGFGQLFNFHLNGPGDCRQTCEWSWQDQGGWHATYRDVTTPVKLVAHLQTDADDGKELVVFGYDTDGNKLRREVAGEWRDGIQIPTQYGYAIPATDAPKVARITGVFKDTTAGTVKLAGVDGTIFGVYEPDERTPQFRRIKISRSCSWVRVAYMKDLNSFSSRYDHVPLRSRIAFLLALQAVKHYSDREWAEAHAAEADAARLEIEAQMKIEPPTYTPIQVINRADALREDDADIR